MKIIGLIPARGSSKRFPGKNLKNIGGQSLISHAIKKMFAAGLYDVYVSTDCDDIANEASNYGANVVRRQSSDKQPMVDVVRQFESVVEYDAVVLHQCTAPLTTVDHIKTIANMLERTDYAYTVVEDTTASTQGLEPFWSDDYKKAKDRCLKDAGALYAMKRGCFKKYENRVLGISMLKIAPDRYMDIDWPHQLELAKSMWWKDKDGIFEPPAKASRA